MVLAIDALEAAALIASSNVDVIDVRDEDEFITGHLPAARLVPLDILRADTAREVDPNRAVLFVCLRGVRSLNAAKMAERLGYDKVYNLEGGTSGWERAGLPLAIGAIAVDRAA